MKKISLSLLIIWVAFVAKAQEDDKLSYKLDYGKPKQDGSKFFENDIPCAHLLKQVPIAASSLLAVK